MFMNGPFHVRARALVYLTKLKFSAGKLCVSSAPAEKSLRFSRFSARDGEKDVSPRRFRV